MMLQNSGLRTAQDSGLRTKIDGKMTAEAEDADGGGPYLQHRGGSDDDGAPRGGGGTLPHVERLLLLVPLAADAAFLAGHAVWLVPVIGPLLGFVLLMYVPFVGVLVRPGPPYLLLSDAVGAGDSRAFLVAYYALEGGIYALAAHGARTRTAACRTPVALGGAWHVVLAATWLVENRAYYPNFPWSLRVPVAYLLCALCHARLFRRMGKEGGCPPGRPSVAPPWVAPADVV